MEKLSRVFMFFILILYFDKTISINIEQKTNREGKVFSLFSIVNFENGACESTEKSTSGNKRNGTCFTSSECGDKGGNSKGSCASGFGVCCLFIINDKTTTDVSQNSTYVQNPNYPSPYADTTSLSYKVTKCSDKVCFLRLDFEDFTIQGPANSVECDDDPATTDPKDDCVGGGKCATDYLVIKPPSTADQNVPKICGQNKGQHIYIGMGSSATDTADLTFTFQGTDANTRVWDIKIAQIECGSSAPPDGCLQYFTGLSGTITTFNFLDKVNGHLADQNYNICMRKEQGYCCNQYQVCDPASTDQPFSLYVADTEANGKAQKISECTQDYITISGGAGACSKNLVTAGASLQTFCGRRFSTRVEDTANAPVCDCTAPFQIGVVTDATADKGFSTKTTDKGLSRGVCLEFQQQPC